LGYAKAKKVEKGRKVRIDCTCVESNIHHPTDSTLLWDAVRVLTRLMQRAGTPVSKIPGFHNHSRVAKRRMLAILNAKRKKQRKAAYADLDQNHGKVIGYAKRTIDTSTPSQGLICVLSRCLGKLSIMSNWLKKLSIKP
jgi:IS5 family transposase